MSNAAARAVGADLAAVLPVHTKPWYRIPHLLKLNWLLFTAMLMSATVGYDNSMMNGLQALGQWQSFMGYPTGAFLGAINAIQCAGSVVGYPAMSWIANKYGRKRSLYVGLTFIAIGVTLQTAANGVAMFMVSRFCVGAASGFFGAVPVLVTEAAYPLHRGRLTAGYNTLYYVGSLIAAWATFGTRDYTTSWAWRVPSLLQIAVPAFSVLTGLLFCPESPRWLIAKGRVDEARRFFVKYHAGGDETSPLVEFEMAEIQAALAMEDAIAKETTYADMWKTKGNRHRLLISVSIGIFAQWNGVGVVSYYLARVLTTVGVTGVTEQTLINGFLQVFNLIVAVVAATQVDRLGRRGLLLYSSAGMLVCYVIITGLSGSFAATGDKGVGLAVIPMLFIYYGFYDIGYTPLLVSYPAEIWPYHLRSKGIAVTSGSTFAALFFNLFVNPIALDSIGWKYYIVYITILVGICATVWFCYPETRGRSLEEIAIIFDGDDAKVPSSGAVLSAVEEKMELNAHNDTVHVEVGSKV